MSNNKNICDPIIDTIEEIEEDNGEVISSTPASERVDPTYPSQDIAYNGDSLVATGSPFKKSYSGSSLEEASVDSLVDEPLQIESVALSPFRMDSIHHSPLPPRQKDPHTFSVSVSDSLPPHVMELDSPERVDDIDDEGFSMGKDSPMKMTEVEDFFSRVKSSSETETGPPQPPSGVFPEEVRHEDDASPFTQSQRETESRWADSESSLRDDDNFSQPMFESQLLGEGARNTLPSVTLTESEDIPLSNPPEELSPSSPCLLKGDSTLDEDIIPPSEEFDSFVAEKTDSTKIAVTHQGSPAPTPGSPAPFPGSHAPSPGSPAPFPGSHAPFPKSSASSPESPASSPESPASPGTKNKGGGAKRHLREGEDSDIEILEERERSIEILFDGSAPPPDSQDLALVLTDTQTQGTQLDLAPPPEPLESRGDISSESQSLLSLPSLSERLTCDDTLSSTEGDSTAPGGRDPTPSENTIRATQVELLCPPAPPGEDAGRSSQFPDVWPLEKLPIKGVVPQGGAPEGPKVGNPLQTQENEPQPRGGTPHGKSSEDGDSNQSTPVDPIPPLSKSSQSTPVPPVPLTGAQCTPVTGRERRGEGGTPTIASKIFPQGTPGQRDTPSQQSQIYAEDSDEEAGKTSASASAQYNKGPSQQSRVYAEDSDEEAGKTSASAQYNKGPSQQSRIYAEASDKEERKTSAPDPAPAQYNKGPSQQSPIYAEDSYEEAVKTSASPPAGKTSAPAPTPYNKGAPHQNGKVIPTLKEIKDPDSNPCLSSTVNEDTPPPSSRPEPEEPKEIVNDTLEVSDLKEGPWQKVECVTIEMEKWRNSATLEEVLKVTGFEPGPVLKPLIFLEEMQTFLRRPATSTTLATSSTFRGRVSDISSISRYTSSSSSSGCHDNKSASSGYHGDKSSSSGGSGGSNTCRSDFSRLSMASVTVLSPPRKPDGGQGEFRPPLPPPAIPQMKDGETQTPPVSLPLQAWSSSSPESAPQPRRPKPGRGRPRGRPRGRGRGREGRIPLDKPPTPIQEDVKAEETNLTSMTGDIRPDSEPEDLYKLLPKFLREKLRSAPFLLSEEEEELFLPKVAEELAEARIRQMDEVQRRVRVASIEPSALVFALYPDKSYYSAFVERRLDLDKWEVRYSLDGCVQTVRERNILPTEILPKGIRCYVRHPAFDFSDPGTIEGHCLSRGGGCPLLHVVGLLKGTVVRAPHSHIILSQEVAEALLEPRRGFHSMIASPGRDLSLDNVVPAKLRWGRAPAVAGVTTPALRNSPHTRKADVVLDTSEGEEGSWGPGSNAKGKGSPRALTNQRIPTLMSESESSETTPKPGKRKTGPRTPRSTGGQPVSANKAKPSQTPQTPGSTGGQPVSANKKPSQTPRSLKRPSSQTPTRNPKAKRAIAVESNGPQRVGDTVGAVSPDKEGPMNPVVELFQLNEGTGASVPQHKKRGRKPGSGTKHVRKARKVESPEDDDSLGPLPPPGCRVLEGYSILITIAATPRLEHNEDSSSNKEHLPFSRERLTAQIVAAGGYVAETFDQAYSLHLQHLLQAKKGPPTPNSGKLLHRQKELVAALSPSKVLCVSNSYCRTAKFIQCLTVGIPIVGATWVSHSIKHGVCLNWLRHLLPAGMSLITGNYMEQPFGDELQDSFSAVGKVVDVLQGEKVFLATSTNPLFEDLWTSLLVAAKAEVFKTPLKAGKIQRLLDRRTTVVIADITIPNEELRRAKDVGVPIVSSEWFIQSLIARCKLPYDAHPKFSYNYNAAPSTTGADVEVDELEGSGVLLKR